MLSAVNPITHQHGNDRRKNRKHSGDVTYFYHSITYKASDIML